ncbi:MAG: hypothetical protein ACYC2G_00660 [Gemmatimonadaceae bacterium]
MNLASGRPMIALGALLWSATVAAAQPATGRKCELEFEPLRDSTTTVLEKQASGTYNAFQAGGVRYRCKDQDMTMDADSAAYYGDLAILYLVGQVHYRDEDASLDADRLTYYRSEEWVIAEGNVFVRMENGSTMRGPSAEYFRAIPDVRPVERLITVGRPTFTLHQPDSAGQVRPATTVIADRVTAEGDSLVYAGGSVQVSRTDLTATSDSVMLDESREYGRLLGAARVVGQGERGFTLTGRTIDLFSRERELERVLALDDAQVESDDVTVTSDTLDLRITDGQLSRAFAWGPGRARAVAPGRDMTADSLDVQLVDQKLRELRAVGGARLESVADTARIRSTERDWLVGDTVIARFDTVVVAAGDDSSANPLLRQVLALGDARSFQQVPPDSGVTDRPSLHYVRGRNITVAFDSGQVQRVMVTAPDSGQTVGVYLDATGRTAPTDRNAPRPPAATTPPPPVDSSARRPPTPGDAPHE